MSAVISRGHVKSVEKKRYLTRMKAKTVETHETQLNNAANW